MLVLGLIFLGLYRGILEFWSDSAEVLACGGSIRHRKFYYIRNTAYLTAFDAVF
jgi:hypothetical protein